MLIPERSRKGPNLDQARAASNEAGAGLTLNAMDEGRMGQIGREIASCDSDSSTSDKVRKSMGSEDLIRYDTVVYYVRSSL